MFGKIAFTAACVLLPVAWGVLVNRLFQFWQLPPSDTSKDDPIFPDYQI